MLYTHYHQPTEDRSPNNINQTVGSFQGGLRNNTSTDISPDSLHPKFKLNNAIEISVVTLDTLTGKRTMICLTTRSTVDHVEQLLGFWEYDLPIKL
jgi:hypothetical protein